MHGGAGRCRRWLCSDRRERGDFGRRAAERDGFHVASMGNGSAALEGATNRLIRCSWRRSHQEEKVGDLYVCERSKGEAEALHPGYYDESDQTHCGSGNWGAAMRVARACNSIANHDCYGIEQRRWRDLWHDLWP